MPPPTRRYATREAKPLRSNHNWQKVAPNALPEKADDGSGHGSTSGRGPSERRRLWLYSSWWVVMLVLLVLKAKEELKNKFHLTNDS